MPDYVRVAARRSIVNRDPALLQLAFDPGVLDRYRGAAGFSIIRTNSAGRLKKEGGWALDFGIGEENALIHASWRALTETLPDEDRAHWAAHVIDLPLSENFLRMQLSPGSCFDDGEVRTW